jgi:hypothetical protein
MIESDRQRAAAAFDELASERPHDLVTVRMVARLRRDDR